MPACSEELFCELLGPLLDDLVQEGIDGSGSMGDKGPMYIDS